MDTTLQKLLRIAGIGLNVAGIIFICLSLLQYQREWTLPAALVCLTLSLLFQIILRQGSK